MRIHSVKNGPSEARALKLTVMQRGEPAGSGPVNTSQTVLSPCKLTVLVKIVRDAKLTPHYPLITVAMSVFHECWHNMWNCGGLFRPFMDYKAAISQQWHFLVF